jgi:hypothetical protein
MKRREQFVAALENSCADWKRDSAKVRLKTGN